MVHGTHNAVQDDRNNHIKIYVNGEILNRKDAKISVFDSGYFCLLYTSPSPRDGLLSRMPSSA